MSDYLFLSYAVEDRLYVEQLAQRLKAEAGVEAWWYQDRQVPGVPYKQELIRRIQGSLAVVVILSSASAHSIGVDEEISLARAESKRIIPIVIGHSSDSLTAHVRSGDVTYALRRLHMIDGNKPAEIIPRLRLFLQTATQPQSPSRTTTPGAAAEPIRLTGYGAKGYEFGLPIAQTNSSVVYKAQELAVGRDVAIKVVLPDLEDRALYRRRFEQEARRVANLEHAYIVPLYNYWSDDEDAYLVMRWMPGGSLGQLIAARKGALTPQVTARIFSQVVDALGFAHTHGVIHRDLKPGNILTDRDGNAYLSDFGIAQQHRAGSKPSSGGGGYTIGYAPPEQIADIEAPATVQNDIYALGAVLYELITGEPAFSGANKTTILQRQMSGEIPSLLRWSESRQRSIPTALDAAINRAMAYDPADRYPNVQSFADAVNEGFRALMRGEGLADSVIRTIVMPQTRIGGANPYKALRPFDEGDAADFFGREALAAQLAARLQRAGEEGRFLAVVGASGSGKSSVVRAGLVPGLRRQPGRYVAVLTPGERPIERLAEALASTSGQPAAELLVLLYSGEGGLVRAVSRILAGDPQAELLLVIDQFEELYTLLDDAEQRRFVLANLATLVADPRGRARLLITLRADFYDRPLSDPIFSRLMEGRTETVLPMSKAELEEAIVKPAHRVGAAIEPALVREMLADIEAQPGALPLLQYALHALYERCGGAPMTLKAYQEGGGLRGALERQADEVLAGLSADQQALAKQIFLRLVTPGDGVEDTRRRVRRSELVALVAAPGGGDLSAAANLNTVLTAFGNKRLLTFDYEPGTREPTVEIAHEALLQSWSDLREWLREARADLRLQRRLSDAVGDWLRQNRDPAYLSSGGPLAQFEELSQRGIVALSPVEREFIAAGRAAEVARQSREIEQARVLAETEKRRADEEAAAKRRIGRQAGLLRMLLAGAGVLALVAAIAAVFAFTNGQAAVRSAEEAQAAQTIAEQNAEDALAAQARAEAEQQRAERNALQVLTGDISSRQPDLSILLSKIAQGMLAGTNDEGQSSALLTTLTSQPELVGYLRGHLGSVEAIALSPDGKILASGGSDHTIILWDLATRKPLDLTPLLAGHRGVVRSLAFSPDGQYLVSAGDDNQILIWNTATWTDPTAIPDTFWVHQVVFHPANNGIFAWGQCVDIADNRCPDSEIRFWRIGAGYDGEPLKGNSGVIYDLDFSRDGVRLISGGADNMVRFWDVASRTIVKTFSNHTDDVYAVAFSPDGSRAVSGGRDARIISYNAINLETIGLPLKAGGESVVTLAYKPDGRTLFSAGFNDRILRWDSTRYPPIPAGTPLVGHTNAIEELSFDRAGTRMFSSSRDGAVVIWNLEGSDLITPVANHTPIRWAGAVSPAGNTLATGGDEPTIQFWDTSTGQRTGQAIDVDEAIYALQFSPDNNYLATADRAGDVRLYSASGERLPWTWLSEGSAVRALAFSREGSLLAYSDNVGEIFVVAVDTGKYRLSNVYYRPEDSTSYAARAIDFHPNGTWLAVGGDAGIAEIWDVTTGTSIREFIGHRDLIYTLAFSPDGALLATGSFDTTVIISESENPQSQRTLSVGGPVYSLAFSADGQTLATGREDGGIQLWEVSTGRPIGGLLTTHQAPIEVLTFINASTLLSNDRDGVLITWNVTNGTTRLSPTPTAGAGTSYSVAYNPDPMAAFLVSGGRDSRVIVVDPADRQNLSVLGDGKEIGHTSNVAVVQVNTKGVIASGGADGLIFLWNHAEVSPTHKLDPADVIDSQPPGSNDPNARQEPQRAAILALAFSPDGNLLASGDADGQVLLWELDQLDDPDYNPPIIDAAVSGAGHDAAIRSLAFSPDGQFLASGSEDNTTIIRDLGGTEIGRLNLQGGEVYALAFSPDGKLLATAGGDDKIILWNTERWTPLGSPMIGHTDTIWGLAFSPDGKLLATGSEDETILIWDVASRRPLGSSIRIGATVWSVAFSPDGTRLAFGASGAQVSAINLSSDTLSQQACAVAARNMSWLEWQTYQPGQPYARTCPDQPLFFGELIAQADTLAQASRDESIDQGARDSLRAQARDAYQQARDTILLVDSPILNNSLCFNGSINGFAEVVLDSCEYAVELTAEGKPLAAPAIHAAARDTFGIALALTNKPAEAIVEFQAYLDWIKSEEDLRNAYYNRYGKRREEWIAALEQGQNPFTPEVLEQLRIE